MKLKFSIRCARLLGLASSTLLLSVSQTMALEVEPAEPGLRHVLVSHPLPVGSGGEEFGFNPEDPASIEVAFAHAHTDALRQYWLELPEDRLRSGTVRTGWTPDALWVYAVMHDEDIYNDAIRNNEHTWRTGDVFEIFLREPKQQSYIEYHVTPDNLTLQLHFPRLTSLAEMRDSPDINLEDFMVEEPVFDSWTFVEPDKQRWSVLTRIPAVNVTGRTAIRPGEQWRYSFCRYDHTRGEESPIRSSTSPHEIVRFHRHPDWGLLVFRE